MPPAATWRTAASPRPSICAMCCRWSNRSTRAGSASMTGMPRSRPALRCTYVGGHTKGLQVVRVHTARGWVVLASDASHYYRNMEEGRPFPAVFNVGDMLEGHRRLQALADSYAHYRAGTRSPGPAALSAAHRGAGRQGGGANASPPAP